MPGGSVSLQNSGYAKAGGLLYKLAIDANNRGDFFPVWGTCLGFELLLCLAAGKNYLTTCSSYDRALPLTFRSGDDTLLYYWQRYHILFSFSLKH